MGIIKEAFTGHTASTSRIAESLERAGFEYGTYVQGTAKGYQKGFYSEDGGYYTYVHCDLENHVLRAYKEYECGGYISDMETDIPDLVVWNDDPERFVEWLDEETNGFINR